MGLAEGGFITGFRLPILVPFLAFVPQLLGRFARRTAVRGQFRRASLWSALLSASPPALFCIAISVLGWQISVRGWLGTTGSLFGWPDLSVLTVLTPFILFQVSAIDAKARVHAGNLVSLNVVRSLQLRMFFASLAPAVLYVLLCAVVGLSETWRASIEEVELLGALYSVLMIALLTALLPSVLRMTWETEVFPKSLHRELLDRVAQRAGFECREILVWKTGNLMANAAIIGLGKRSRYVLFSDALIARLELRELAAVFAHEIGHAMRRHVPVFLAWTIAFFLALGFVGEELGLLEGSEPFGLVGVALLLGYWGFGYMSRRFELDADLYAMQLLNDPESMIAALEKVGGRLRDVAGWRHFSVAKRVAFLRSAHEDSNVAKRLRRTIQRFSRTGFALLAITLFAQAWSLASSWSTDQVYVDLRLGNYTHAATRIEQLDEPDEGLEQLVGYALRLVENGRIRSESELTSECFEKFAHDAAAEENRELTFRYLELGFLRGDRGLLDACRALDFAEDGELEEARSMAETLTPSWRDALMPMLQD